MTDSKDTDALLLLNAAQSIKDPEKNLLRGTSRHFNATSSRNKCPDRCLALVTTLRFGGFLIIFFHC